MPRIAQLILALIIGLALLTWAASGVVETTVREWFERDVSSRAHLVLTSASQSLAHAWSDPKELDGQLQAFAREERVMAVLACGVDLSTRSSTPGFPQEFNCLEVGPRVRTADSTSGNAEQPLHEWSTIATLPTGRVQVSAMPISVQGQEVGFAILVQDLSYIEPTRSQSTDLSYRYLWNSGSHGLRSTAFSGQGSTSRLELGVARHAAWGRQAQPGFSADPQRLA